MQKLLVFALVAGLLILQLSPPALARRSNSNTEETEVSDVSEVSVVEDSANAGECFVSIFNFLIGQLNTAIPAIALGFAACEVPCGASGTTGSCIACIFAVIPTLPMIPTDLDGCS